MASCTTSLWASNAPRARLTVTQSSSTGNSATLSWKLEFLVTYAFGGMTTPRAYSVKIDGDTVKSGTYTNSGNVGTYTIASGTKTVSKNTSARSISFSCSFAFNYTWGGIYKGTLSASGSISVAAKSSYSVKYNANGGSGAPSSQTKWYGTTLKLSSTKPTRTGYSFQGWATSASGSVVYSAGANYTANAAVTLYAVWKANTYTVSYDANGGTGAPANQTKTYGVSLTLSSTIPTRTNYNFLGWGTSAASTTVSYAAGAAYTTNAAITLYAIWEIAYIEPRITDFTVNRCDADGTSNDNGTYARVIFNWATDKAVSGISVAWVSASQNGSTNISASGTSGNVNQIVGDGTLSTDSTYTFTITVSDSDGTSSVQGILNGTLFAIDFLAGGKGVAFGKPAEQEGMDVNMHLCLRKGMSVANADGTKLIETVPMNLNQGEAIPVNADLDDYNVPGIYCCNASTASTLSNSPVDNTGIRLTVQYVQGNALFNQTIITGDGRILYRYFSIDHYGDWKTITAAGNNLVLDSGWITPQVSNVVTYNGATGNEIRYRKINGIVHILGVVSPSKDDNGMGGVNTVPVFTLPAGYRPCTQVVQVCQGSSRAIWTLNITTSGTVGFCRYRNSFSAYEDPPIGTWMAFSVMFEVSEDLNSGASDIVQDTGWVPLQMSNVTYAPGYPGTALNYRRLNGVVMLRGVVVPTSSNNSFGNNSGTGTTICNLPEDCRPVVVMRYLCSTDTTDVFTLVINTDGNVNISRYRSASGTLETPSTSAWMYINITFISK